MGTRACRIGIDVGGTFTDFVLVETATGKLTFFKEPSVPSDPSASVERGIVKVIDRAGVSPSDVEFVIHGTTLGLNAIIQRRGANVALVVPRGFRDVLEIARSKMPNSYDLKAGKEQVLVPRDRVFEVDARIDHEGNVLREPTAESLDDVAAAIGRTDCSAVAVMLLHSYLHPTQENAVVAALRDRLPGRLVSSSAEIWPEIREYERALVTVLNAYVNPLMDDYLTKLKTRLRGVGVEAPVYITSSNGGTLSVDTARERPIDTILSGPASGVVAAQFTAAKTAQQRIITFDMGGTSSDIAVSKSGEPEYTTRTTVGDFPLVLPVINVSAIGAGGGSIVWVDDYGLLKIGPDSAGADPGPVSYGRGGERPTITDCYLVAGFIDPDRFLGGRMTLDRAAAERALGKIAERLGMASPAEAAEAALRVATAVMATELRKSLAQRGEDPRSFALMPFGGAGPTHANMLAAEAHIDAMLIPSAPGTFCAMGATRANVKRDYIRSLRHRVSSVASTNTLLTKVHEELSAEGLAWIAGEGAGLGDPMVTVSADMRYVGQAFDLGVPVDAGSGIDSAAICEAFHALHERYYGFRDVESPIEIVTLRARIEARLPSWDLAPIEARPEAKAFTHRNVFHDGASRDVPVFDRHALAPGQRVEGPAILEQEDTTIWILPQWTLTVDASGSIVVEKLQKANDAKASGLLERAA